MSMYGVPPVPPAPGSWPGAVATGPINQDVVCRKCGYNLRGLSADGRCPECGTAVGYSLQGDLLRFCDPNWVDILRRGASLFIWGIVLIVLGAIGASVMTASIGTPLLGVLVVIGGWILTTVGWWFMTQPDPSGLGEENYGTARKIIRIALIVGVVQQVVDKLPQLTNIDPTVTFLLVIASFAMGLVGVVGFFAQLNYLKKLALRIPDQKLSGRAHFLMFALGISYGLLILASLLLVLVARSGSPSSASGALGAFGCFAGIVGIAALIFVIMYLLLVEKMGKRFKEQAQAARASWASTAFSRAMPPA